MRDVIKSDIRKKSLVLAARKYQDFLNSSPQERAWLEAWANADSNDLETHAIIQPILKEWLNYGD